MEIGQVVWVVAPSGFYSDIIIWEVEVTSKPAVRHHINKFGAKPIRKYSYEEGWKDAHCSDLNYFRTKQVYASREAALVAFKEAHQYSIQVSQGYVAGARETLAHAQKSLLFSESRLSLLQGIDVEKVFEKDTYVSPFTGGVV